MSGRVAEPGTQPGEKSKKEGGSNGHRPLTFDHLVSEKKPNRLSIELVTDSDLAEDFREVSVRLELAKMQHADQDNPVTRREVLTAQRNLDAVREKAAPAVKVVTMQSIGRSAYRRLQEKYPPTDEQRAKAVELGIAAELEVDTDAFPPAVVAASCVEPEMTLEQAQQLWDDPNWNFGELMALYNAALAVNQQRPVVNLGKGSGLTRS